MTLQTNKKMTLPQKSITLFITGLLLLPVYIDLMGALSQTLGFNSQITTFIYYGALWILLIGAIPQIAKAIGAKEVLGIMLVAAFVCCLCFLYPNSHNFLMLPLEMDVFLFAPKTVVAVVPYILIGLAIHDTQTLAEYMHTGARIGVIGGTLAYIIAIAGKHEINYDDMDNAYALCILVCILVTNYQKGEIYFLICGCFSLLIAGTRGPVVAVVLAVMMRILVVEKNPTKKVVKILAGVVVILCMQSKLMLGLLELIANGFKKIGITELRIIEYFQKGILMDDSGRDVITNTIIDKIVENPLLGYGPGGDRNLLLSDAYSHNLFLEIWVSYGLILGTAILAWIGYWVLSGLFTRDKALQVVVTALFCSVVIKLLLSSSYLHSKELFVLLGICMAGCKSGNKKTKILFKENDHE